MNCICILKSKNSADRINTKYEELIHFDFVREIDELRELLINREYDFAILDYSLYFYHEAIEILDNQKIETLLFKGKFQDIEIDLEKRLKEYKENKEEKIKYVIKEKEVEKKVEVQVEVPVEVEKIKYKKVIISVITGKKGVGSTHYSLCIAKYLKKFNSEFNVAVVEIGDNKLESNIKDGDIDIYSFENISDYYLNKQIREYDYLILDLGYYDRENLNQLLLSSDLKIAIFGAKKWEMVEMQKFLRYMGKIKIIKEINFIYNFALDDDYKEIESDMGELKIYRGVYCLDYRSLNEELNSMLLSLLNPYLNIYKEYDTINNFRNKKSIFNIFKRK